MSKNYEYILSLKDRVSGTMKKITGSSLEANGKFTQLAEKSKALDRVIKDFGGSISNLRQKMDLLRQERDLINPKELKTIRQYNAEIKGLSKEIDKLEKTSGGKFQSSIKAAFAEIPSILKNPVALGGAAIGFMGKSAMSFDQGMAKVNTTAQMEGQDFEDIKARVKQIAKLNKADMSIAPNGFEKIISQTGDAEVSLSILDSALKGSKAGFTDLDTVSGALAQTLSIVGKENTTAKEVLDTFFAAKRVGAGEFKDFANYMPGLIAGADNLGVKYKDVAGIFAYMTGKGQSAERASVLMSNMFSVMGKKDITDKLSKMGVNIFGEDEQMRSVVDIFKDLNNLTSKMSDQEQTNFFDQVGLVDKEAKASFAIMAADTGKLSVSLSDCNNAIGETDKALKFSKNSMQTATELWNQFKNVGTEIGGYLLPVINAGMQVLGGVLSVVSPVLETIVTATTWWFDKLGEGSPVIWGVTTALGAALVMFKAHVMWLKTKALWDGITAASTGVLSKAMTALKASFLGTPWGLAIVGVSALVGGMVALMSKTDGTAKSLAAFNVELRRNKEETKGAFDAATQAKDGSVERAAAIQKINEKYGEYLPHLLEEKSSNDELAGALSIVNVELERKRDNKFRDQQIEAAKAKYDEAETQVFQWVGENVAPEQRQAALKELRVELDKLKAGTTDWKRIQEGFGKKYNLGSFFDFTSFTGGGGTTWQGEYYNSFGNVAMDMQDAAHNFKQAIDDINIQRSSSPQPQVVNNIYPAANLPWQGASWMQKANTPFVFGRNEPSATAGDTQGEKKSKTVTSQSSNAGGSGSTYSSSASSSTVDLDKIVPQAIKGSTSYGAIASKIASFQLPSLAKAAAAIALPMSVAATQLPNVLPADANVDNPEYASGAKNKIIAPQKFCDKIEIHIGSADGKGYEQVRTEIMTAVTKAIGGDYEA